MKKMRSVVLSSENRHRSLIVDLNSRSEISRVVDHRYLTGGSEMREYEKSGGRYKVTWRLRGVDGESRTTNFTSFRNLPKEIRDIFESTVIYGTDKHYFPS